MKNLSGEARSIILDFSKQNSNAGMWKLEKYFELNKARIKNAYIKPKNNYS